VFDPDRLPELKSLVREATRGDSGLLDDVMRDVVLLRHSVTTIQPRNINSISLVASDGGNNSLEFNPFSLQVIRVVDTFGDELFLDVISPSTDTLALGRRHLDDPASPLGRMMRDLDVSTLGQLSTMIPATPRSRTWPLVYRDLCEWAVLYDLVCYERWGSDTLIIRDGLLRSTIFAQDQFLRVYGLMKAAIERTKEERKRDVFLVGLAKHSRVIERYRLAMAVEDVFPAGQPCYASVPLELQVKVYDWPEYVWSPEEDPADREKPKTNMGAIARAVRPGRAGERRRGDPGAHHHDQRSGPAGLAGRGGLRAASAARGPSGPRGPAGPVPEVSRQHQDPGRDPEPGRRQTASVRALAPAASPRRGEGRLPVRRVAQARRGSQRRPPARG
jgi:hypothetical protein